jgi:WhiB family transcriptional regulator, redox-sensing transcriptional regulator
MTTITASRPWPTTPRPGGGPRVGRRNASRPVPALAAPACASADPELFFPPSPDPRAEAAAWAYCRACPARRACLEGALARGEEHGIWGGVNMENRPVLRKVLTLRAMPATGAPEAPEVPGASQVDGAAPGPVPDGLGPMDVARRLGALRATYTSKKAVARAAGMGAERAAMYLDLLELDDSTQARVQAGTLNVAAAVNAVRAERALGGRRAS